MDGKSFSEEADSALNELTRNRVMQCQPVAVAENSIPYIHLMAQQPDHTVSNMEKGEIVNGHCCKVKYLLLSLWVISNQRS